MGHMEKLLEALEECGVVAAFYKGQNILSGNKRFAELFERSTEECKMLPILEICHEESIDIIQDFRRRRVFGEHNVPTTYEAKFRTPTNPNIIMIITVIRTENTEGALLVIVQEKK